MRLDRNITNPKRGKYALIKLRVDTPVHHAGKVADGRTLRVKPEAVDFGDTLDSDFFVIRLKDKYAGPALTAYANAAAKDDPEYAAEISALAWAAQRHPNRRSPD